MSDEDLEDRRVSFDCLMIIVSRSVELTTSIPMLEFLGIDLLADRKYKKRRVEYLESRGPGTLGKDGGTKEKEEEEESEDLFSEKKKTTGGADDKLFEDNDEDLFTDFTSEQKTSRSTERGLN